jgi:hypothetical protein
VFGSSKACSLFQSIGYYANAPRESDKPSMDATLIFLLVLLLGKKIPTSLPCLLSYSERDRKIIKDANQSSNLISEITQENSPLYQLVALALSRIDPVAFYNFFQTCINEKILSHDYFNKILQILLVFTSTPWIRVKERVLTILQKKPAQNPLPLYLIPADKLTAEQLHFATPYYQTAPEQKTATTPAPATQTTVAIEQTTFYPSLLTFVPAEVSVSATLEPIYKAPAMK